MTEARIPAIGSVWKHYEGHIYTVVGQARHVDANIWMIVCRRQDDSSLWLFHRSSWGKRVSVDVPLLALATDSKSEIEELRAENERLQSIIASLMPGMLIVSSELRPKAITNRRIADTDGPDYYPTPEWATWAMCVHEGIWGDIWEPAAGDGAMLNVLRREQKKQSPLQICYGSDLYPRGDAAIATVDFLGDITRDDPHSPWSRSWDMIVTNPPYHSAEDFVLRALQICNSRVAMLLRLQFLEGAKRHKTLFDYNPPSRVWVFSERVTFYPARETPKGSGTTAYAWFIWDLRCPRRIDDAELRWIRPGTKARYVSSEKGERDEQV